MAGFKTEIPFALRAGKREPGSTLGPFVNQQLGPAEFRDRFVSDLKKTNPVFMANKYGAFQEKLDLTRNQDTGQMIPKTGKDPFAISGPDYLNAFLANYDKSLVIEPDKRVNAAGLGAFVQQPAQSPQKFPGSEGTAVA